MSLIIRKLTTDEIEETGGILGKALMVEPGYASVLPDDGVRCATLTALITDALRDAVPQEAVLGAYDRDHRILGAALWGPPGAFPPSEKAHAAEPQQLPPYLQCLPPDQLAGLLAYDEACLRHFPAEPVWYLQILGVDPLGQGNGVGSSLMRASMEMIDATGKPAYLETGTLRNVLFYERFGFLVREEKIRLAPGSLSWTMLRPPREPDPGLRDIEAT